MQKKIRGKEKKGHTGAHINSQRERERERENARPREKGRENTSAGMMGKEVDTYEPGMSQDLVISSDNSMDN